MDVGFFNAGLF